MHTRRCVTHRVRVVDVFDHELDLRSLGFGEINPAVTGRPAYHPAVPLKLHICGYLNRIQSSRRLEREAQRNVEPMWLTGRLGPDFKIIADFRRSNGAGICNVCKRFIAMCRQLADQAAAQLIHLEDPATVSVANTDNVCHRVQAPEPATSPTLRRRL